MKKLLALLIALASLSCFTACNDDEKESKPSRSEESEAVITDSEIEEKKEAENSKEENYNVLDTDWESDYIKFDVSSNWEKSRETLDEDIQIVSFYFEDNNIKHEIKCAFDISTIYTKLSTFELEEDWLDLQAMYEKDGEINYLYDESPKIVDKFVENGVACIVIASDESDRRTIEFSNDGIYGRFTYNENCEDIVKNMIGTIEFY